MRIRKTIPLLCAILCFVLPLAALAADAPTEITPKKEVYYVNEGKRVDIRLSISPRAARTKGVTYESDNEAIATVNSRGRVVGVAQGSCNILVTSKYDGTSIQVPVQVILPVKSIALSAPSTTLRAGEQLQLSTAFTPADATVQTATYKSSKSKIATVDENGLVTGITAGKVSIVANATDGSKARGKITLTIEQPVTGVSYKTPHVRVGVNYHGSFTATLEPKNATNHNMTWVSDDPSIASVSGSKNKMRIEGYQWGQTTVTGTTEDGGYQVSIVVDIGSLRHAVRIHALTMRDGKPRIAMKNNSNMNITQVRYLIKGYDKDGNVVPMSRDQDVLRGSYDHALAPGDSTQHGNFNFIHKSDFANLDHFELAITGWNCDTGYYNSKGEVLYSYNLAEDHYEWIASK